MSAALTLIQLISEQTIQNLLPILRLRPARLVHLVTAKTAGRSAHLVAASHAAGLDPGLAVVQLSSMPGIQESFNAVMDCIGQASAIGETSVVNFTGGTKLMSIGAYAAALQQKVPSLYVDTQDACFVDGGTSPGMSTLLAGDWSFTPIRKQLRVDTIAIANGVPRVTNGRAWKPLLPLALHFYRQPDEEEATHEAFHGPSGLVPHGREPKSPKEWLPLLNRPLTLPPRVAGLAVAAGIIRVDSQPAFFLPSESRDELHLMATQQVPDFRQRYFKAVAPIQQAISILTGGWWEVVVADAIEQSGLVRDLRWSVEVGEQSGSLEEDLVALDGVELVYVSCKRGGHKARLLPLLEEVRARAATLGGTFNRRFLAVRHPPVGRMADNLRNRARELGIRLITGDDVYRAGAFAR